MMDGHGCVDAQVRDRVDCMRRAGIPCLYAQVRLASIRLWYRESSAYLELPRSGN
jgi:hypothetical protein